MSFFLAFLFKKLTITHNNSLLIKKSELIFIEQMVMTHFIVKCIK